MSFLFQPRIEYIDSNNQTITINFPYPPEADPLNESYRSNWLDDYTDTGVFNRTPKFILHKFSLRFKFLTNTTIQQIRTMYEDVAFSGSNINLFPDTAKSEVYEVRIMTTNLRFMREVYNDNLETEDKFLYALMLDFERTLKP